MKIYLILLLLLLSILAFNITSANAVPQIPGCTWKIDDTYTCTTPDGIFDFVCPPSEDGTCYPNDKFPEGCFDVGTPIKCPDDEKVIPLVPLPHEPEPVQKKPTYKIWVLAYNVDPKAGFVSACAFGPSVDTPNCAYFDLSKIFIEKGGKKDFIAGFVSIVSNTPPPSDMQVCLEAQLLNGTNASPGNWSRCGPVIKDNKGFYISKTDFTELDHSKLVHANTNIGPTPNMTEKVYSPKNDNPKE